MHLTLLRLLWARLESKHPTQEVGKAGTWLISRSCGAEPSIRVVLAAPVTQVPPLSQLIGATRSEIRGRCPHVNPVDPEKNSMHRCTSFPAAPGLMPRASPHPPPGTAPTFGEKVGEGGAVQLSFEPFRPRPGMPRGQYGFSLANVIQVVTGRVRVRDVPLGSNGEPVRQKATNPVGKMVAVYEVRRRV